MCIEHSNVNHGTEVAQSGLMNVALSKTNLNVAARYMTSD